MDLDKEITAITAVFGVVIFIAFSLGYHQGCTSVERDAVKAGVATYTADERGYSIFTWKK
jgi:hypothetical protein